MTALQVITGIACLLGFILGYFCGHTFTQASNECRIAELEALLKDVSRETR